MPARQEPTHSERCRRVGIIVDHPQRDLPGCVLLALALTELGMEALLIPLYEQGIDIPLLDLDVLILNFARDANLPLAQTYAALGISLYVLDTEGGVMSNTGRASPTALAEYVAGSPFAGLLSGYFFWGTRLHDAFVEANALPPEALHLTGCPRFDLYQAPLVDYTPSRRRGHILVNTNFPLVNPRFVADGSGDRRALESVGQAPEYIDALFDANRNVLAGMLALVRRLSNDFPDETFVLRPHPFEDVALYQSELVGETNILVDSEGPVIEALRGAKALLHCNCSTAIEAIMLGVPPITPDWTNSDFLVSHAPLPSKASIRYDNYEAMASALTDDFASDREALSGLYQDVVFDWFHHDDGKAAERIADILNHNTARKLPTISWQTSVRSGRAQPSPAQRAQGLLANVIGSRASSVLRAKLRPARKAKQFTHAVVAELSARYAQAGGDRQPLVSQALHPVSRMPLASVRVAPAHHLTPARPGI